MNGKFSIELRGGKMCYSKMSIVRILMFRDVCITENKYSRYSEEHINRENRNTELCFIYTHRYVYTQICTIQKMYKYLRYEYMRNIFLNYNI